MQNAASTHLNLCAAYSALRRYREVRRRAWGARLLRPGNDPPPPPNTLHRPPSRLALHQALAHAERAIILLQRHLWGSGLHFQVRCARRQGGVVGGAALSVWSLLGAWLLACLHKTTVTYALLPCDTPPPPHTHTPRHHRMAWWCSCGSRLAHTPTSAPPAASACWQWLTTMQAWSTSAWGGCKSRWSALRGEQHGVGGGSPLGRPSTPSPPPPPPPPPHICPRAALPCWGRGAWARARSSPPPSTERSRPSRRGTSARPSSPPRRCAARAARRPRWVGDRCAIPHSPSARPPPRMMASSQHNASRAPHAARTLTLITRRARCG